MKDYISTNADTNLEILFMSANLHNFIKGCSLCIKKAKDEFDTSIAEIITYVIISFAQEKRCLRNSEGDRTRGIDGRSSS